MNSAQIKYKINVVKRTSVNQLLSACKKNNIIIIHLTSPYCFVSLSPSRETIVINKLLC